MEPVQHETPKPLPSRKRPIFLTVLCLFSWIYFFVFSLLFITGFFYSGWVTEAINTYAPVNMYSSTEIKLIMGLFSILFLLAFSGTIVMWFMRRSGYYIFGISILVLTLLQLFQREISYSGIIIFISLLILFGLYFRRFR